MNDSPALPPGPSTSPPPEPATDWFNACDGEDQPDHLLTRDDLDQNAMFTWELREKFLRGPCHIATFDGKLNIQALVDRYRKSISRSCTTVSRGGKPTTRSLILDLGDGCFVDVHYGQAMVLAPTPEAAATISGDLRKFMIGTGKKTVGFRMLSVENGGIVTQFIQIQRPLKLSDESLRLHYGDDFPAWEAEWLAEMAARSSGLSILHGPPGCGKTTYLRALMGKLLDTHVFYYLPVSEFHAMTNPALVGFWLHESRRRGKKQKIAIIEDAEELLVQRDDTNRDKVSNLLNIGDGFMGDHLRIQIIATTNVPLRDMDPAITRAGRLVGCREFPRMTAHQAGKLAESRGITLPGKSDYSLGEIYAHAPVGKPQGKPARIGFGR